MPAEEEEISGGGSNRESCKHGKYDMNFVKNLIILEVLLFFSLFVFAEESVTFSKYETEHQILYFSSNLDPSVIDRLIADAERSEEFIKALYGWVPKKKIAVVYDRETDTANGWSNAFMKNSIFLYLYPPDR